MRRIIIFGLAICFLNGIFPVVTFAHSPKKAKLFNNAVDLKKQTNKHRAKKRLKNVKHSIELAVQKASKLYNLSPHLIRALIQAESGGGIKGVYAVSKRNASGLTQMLPSTAKEMGVRDLFDIEQNIMGGSGYLRKLLDKFDNIYLGLIAYNWGPRNTLRALRGQKPFPISVKRYASRIIVAIREA